MRWLWLGILIAFHSASAGLEKYEELIPPRELFSTISSSRGVRIIYLGTNGYLLQSRGATVLVDPYFSRMGFVRSALGLRTRGRPEFVARWLESVGHVDAVLVTHGHVDHLYDAPQIVRATGAKLIASPTSVYLARAARVPGQQCRAVTGDSGPVTIGSASVRALPATHDRILGLVPFEGRLSRLPDNVPQCVSDWKCGEPLAFLVEMGGERIFINSGSAAGDSPPANLGRIDLAILGVATSDARHALPAAIAALKPRLILPSHQDDFFRPVDKPFTFLLGSDFPGVLRVAESHRSKVMLLRPFQSWTLR